MFPDDQAKQEAEELEPDIRAIILQVLGEKAQGKYDDFVVQRGAAKGYDLQKLQGSLQFAPNLEANDNQYWLESWDQHWTDIANYFEYGTGLYNTKRAGKYRAGYIKPVHGEYLRISKRLKYGKGVITDKVAGVKPVFAMTLAIEWTKKNRLRLQKRILREIQNG